MERILHRRPADLFLPIAVAGAAGAAATVAVLGGASPIVAAGVIGVVLMLLLPMNALLVLFVFASIYSRGHGFAVGPFNVLPGQILLVPLALRVFLLSNPAGRPRWAWPEWLLLAWLGLQFLTSYLNAPNPKLSLIVAGQLTLGGGAYLTMYSVTDSKKRLVMVARAILIVAAANALIGLMAVVGRGLHIGLADSFLAGRPGHGSGVSSLPKGLSVENNVFGSTAASAAIAFFVLMRERNQVITRKFAVVGFWLCSLAALVSSTRGAWVGYLFALAALLFLSRGRTPRATSGVAPILLAGVITLGAVAGFWLSTRPPPLSSGSVSKQGGVSQDATQLFNFGSGTGAHRLTEWGLALGDLQRSPLLGLGTNSYGQLHLALTGSPKNPIPGYLGSIYIRTLHDSGLIGFTMFMIFLGWIAWPRRWLMRATGDVATVARAFTFGYLVLAVAYAATDASFQPWPWIILGVARIATAMAFRHRRREQTERAASPVPQT